MIISGIQKFTLLDFPDTPACVIFTAGCNFRCHFCHNPEFVLPEKIAALSKNCIAEEHVMNFLKKRKGMLDGVVISGGEPTLMPDLAQFLRKVRGIGFLVKLDTNGNNPTVLRSLVREGLVDYVAMDFKTSLPTYQELAGRWADQEKLAESVAFLKKNEVAYEFRSTLVRELHTEAVLEAMRETLRGARRLYLQQFRNAVTLDSRWRAYHPFSAEEMSRIAGYFSQAVETVAVRAS